jgi:uncharacterized OB-fold protein
LAYEKPLPLVNDLNRPHWEGARRGELMIQRCAACGHLQFPPLPNCTRCLAEDLGWTRVSGKGKVFSFVVYHQAWSPGFQAEVPYNVAIVELEEGVRLISNIVDVPNDRLAVDLPVEVTFEAVTEELAVPKFTPAG